MARQATHFSAYVTVGTWDAWRSGVPLDYGLLPQAAAEFAAFSARAPAAAAQEAAPFVLIACLSIAAILSMGLGVCKIESAILAGSPLLCVSLLIAVVLLLRHVTYRRRRPSSHAG